MAETEGFEPPPEYVVFKTGAIKRRVGRAVDYPNASTQAVNG
jgi:hypothetical protein